MGLWLTKASVVYIIETEISVNRSCKGKVVAEKEKYQMKIEIWRIIDTHYYF